MLLLKKKNILFLLWNVWSFRYSSKQHRWVNVPGGHYGGAVFDMLMIQCKNLMHERQTLKQQQQKRKKTSICTLRGRNNFEYIHDAAALHYQCLSFLIRTESYIMRRDKLYESFLIRLLNTFDIYIIRPFPRTMSSNISLCSDTSSISRAKDQYAGRFFSVSLSLPLTWFLYTKISPNFR